MACNFDMRAFPFDHAVCDFTLYTVSHWKTFDQSAAGGVFPGRTYRLVRMRQGIGEGRFIRLGWDGSLPEWNTHGVSTRLHEVPTTAAGRYETILHVKLHVSRMSGFYVSKVLLPTWWMALLSFRVFGYHVEQLAERDAIIATYFLASLSLVYVVGQFLPKLDFTTPLDDVLLLTMLIMVLEALASSIVHAGNNWGYGEAAVVADAWFMWLIMLGYAVGNVVILGTYFAWGAGRRRATSPQCLAGDCEADGFDFEPLAELAQAPV